MDTEILKREAFYNLNHYDFKAEFINGEIYYHEPNTFLEWNTHSKLSSILLNYVINNSLGIVGMHKVMIALTRNDYEPDIVFFSNEKSAGFTSDQMLFPPPDLAVEILSPSTEKYDREIKYADYAAHGVTEYWIVDPEQKTIEQYLLAGKDYRLHVKLQEEGVLHSSVIQGFSIYVAEIFN
jgi:Uma2 family endonuclease